MNFGTRLVALFNGLIAVIATVAVDALYSLAHTLQRVAGFTPDSSHFFIGLGVAVVQILGLIVSLFNSVVGAIVLLLASIGFFFIVGWWAIIPLVFAINTLALMMTSAHSASLETRLRNERNERHEQLPSAPSAS